MVLVVLLGFLVLVVLLGFLVPVVLLGFLVPVVLLGFLVPVVLPGFLFLVAMKPFAPLPFARLIVYPQVPRLIFMDERDFREPSSFSATGSVFPPDLLDVWVFNHLENAGSAILFPRDFRRALSFRT